MFKKVPLEFLIRAFITLIFFGSYSLSSSDLNFGQNFGALNSFHALRYAAKMERNLYRQTKWELGRGHCALDPVKHEEKDLIKLNEYYKDYKSSTIRHLRGIKDVHLQNALNDEDSIVASSVVLVARMTNRFNKYGGALQTVFSSTYDNFGFAICNGSMTYEKYPGFNEYKTFVSTLVSTYRYYDLMFNPEELLKEITTETTSSAEITAQIARDICNAALSDMNYVQAFDWVNFALERVYNGDMTIAWKYLVELKLEMVHEHNTHRSQDETMRSGVDQFCAHNISDQEVGTKAEESWIRRKEVRHLLLDSGSYNKNSRQFAEVSSWSLCSNLNMQAEDEKANLTCFLETKSHSWWRIMPLKVEFLSKNPEILQFHDILGEKFILKIVKTIEEAEMSISQIVDDDNDYSADTLSMRSSVTTWLEDSRIPKLAQITGAISGLEVKDSVKKEVLEPFQAVEYVVGRYYSTHSDDLNDVDLGGSTAFGSAGVAAVPEKGSAIFWYNSYRNGTPREDVWHCACPVLRGRKLVINKWIHSNAQFQALPCTLNESE